MTVPARARNGSAPRPVRPADPIPPHDSAAERVLLVALFDHPDAAAAAREIVSPGDFFDPSQAKLYAGALGLADLGVRVTPEQLAILLAEQGAPLDAVAIERLVELRDTHPADALWRRAAERVRDLARDRRELDAAQRLVAGIRTSDPDLAERARADLSAVRAPADSPRRAMGAADVLTGWTREGPLAHEPTGIAALDALTGGGPVYGTRGYIAGAPDAGKTALLLMIAHIYAQRGIAVGLLAVDEDASDLVTRLAQRCGWSRHHCEARDAGVVAEMREALGHLPIRLYDDRWTIESAAADLAAHAAGRGSRAMLGIDSVQTVRCDAELGAELAEVAAVTARVRAIRAVASRHHLIALVTSEQGRGSYAARDASQRTSALASAKWSGAVEYSARVLLSLSSVPGQSDLVQVEIAKNKHGPRTDGERVPHLYFRIDRRSQTLTEVSYEPPPEPDAATARADRDRGQATADAETVLALVAAEPGIGTRDLYAAARAAQGMGRPRVDAAIRALGERIERRAGPRDSRRHYPAGGAP